MLLLVPCPINVYTYDKCTHRGMQIHRQRHRQMYPHLLKSNSIEGVPRSPGNDRGIQVNPYQVYPYLANLVGNLREPLGRPYNKLWIFEKTSGKHWGSLKHKYIEKANL